MQQRVVHITVTGRVPCFLVVIGAFGAWEESFLEDSWIPRLVEGGDS